MIVVTRLNNTRFAVNPDLIERIQSSPDTTLTLVSGTSYIVTESMDKVIEMIASYRAAVIARARAMPVFEGPASPLRGVVPLTSERKKPVGASSGAR
jgi:flagellar protein FlbD